MTRIAGLAVVVGEHEDEHSDHLEHALNAAGHRVLRTSLAQFSTDNFTWALAGSIDIGRDSLSPAAGIWRRPGRVVVDDYRPEYSAFVDDEVNAAFAGVLAVAPVRWLSSPESIRRAEMKVVQLHMARCLGIPVPETIVTNDPDRALRFARAFGPVVAKPVRYGLVATDPQPLVAWTIAPSESELKGLAGSPIIL